MAQVVLGCGCIALLFGVVLIAPSPPWLAQPPVPPATGQVPASSLGSPAVVLALAFALGLCLPYRPYALAVRAAARLRSKRTVLVATMGLAAVALMIYPRFGSDLFV